MPIILQGNGGDFILEIFVNICKIRVKSSIDQYSFKPTHGNIIVCEKLHS
jgi:hypothetical protein